MLQIVKQILNSAKRGQTAGLNLALTIGVFVFIIAGFAIGLAAFQDSTTDANATTIIGDGLGMLVNLSGQFGTIGTLIGVGILIAVIVGSFAVGAFMMGGRGGRGGGF